MTVPMRGPAQARGILTSFLETNLPPAILAARGEWGLTVEDLPDVPLATPATETTAAVPSHFVPEEPGALDRFPLVAVTTARAPRMRRLESVDPSDVEYRVTYAARVFLWVRAQGFEQAIRTRDNLTAVTRVLLLDRPSLGNDHTYVEENSMVEDYSDVQPVKGERFVAGAFVGFDLQVDERVVRANLGRVGTVTTTTTVYPPTHPALE